VAAAGSSEESGNSSCGLAGGGSSPAGAPQICRTLGVEVLQTIAAPGMMGTTRRVRL
jgi:hypothetical protein